AALVAAAPGATAGAGGGAGARRSAPAPAGGRDRLRRDRARRVYLVSLDFAGLPPAHSEPRRVRAGPGVHGRAGRRRRSRLPLARRPAGRRAPGVPRGRARYRGGYITGPMIQGANSSSPTPESSLFDRLPDATAITSSKICRPTSGKGVPSRITPQLMSMSSCIWRNMRLLVASLIEGTGLQPNTEPRP